MHGLDSRLTRCDDREDTYTTSRQMPFSLGGMPKTVILAAGLPPWRTTPEHLKGFSQFKRTLVSKDEPGLPNPKGKKTNRAMADP